MSEATIREAKPEDAEAFAACHLACWHEAYETLWGADRLANLTLDRMVERRRAEIEQGTTDHYLAEQEGQVVGIAIAGPTRDDPAPTARELYASYLRADYYGSGIADELVQAAIGDGPACLWVYRDNARATAFYVNHDFIPDGEERQDSEGILEIRMVRR